MALPQHGVFHPPPDSTRRIFARPTVHPPSSLLQRPESESATHSAVFRRHNLLSLSGEMRGERSNANPYRQRCLSLIVSACPTEPHSSNRTSPNVRQTTQRLNCPANRPSHSRENKPQSVRKRVAILVAEEFRERSPRSPQRGKVKGSPTAPYMREKLKRRASPPDEPRLIETIRPTQPPYFFGASLCAWL